MRLFHTLSITGFSALAAISGATIALAHSGGETSSTRATTHIATSSAKCSVTVDRSQAADVFRVDEQKLIDGSCVCYIYTGPTNQSGETEAKISAIVANRSCPQSNEVASRGKKGIVPLYIGGGLLGAGLLGALTTGSNNRNDSPGG